MAKANARPHVDEQTQMTMFALKLFKKTTTQTTQTFRTHRLSFRHLQPELHLLFHDFVHCHFNVLDLLMFASSSSYSVSHYSIILLNEHHHRCTVFERLGLMSSLNSSHLTCAVIFVVDAPFSSSIRFADMSCIGSTFVRYTRRFVVG